MLLSNSIIVDTPREDLDIYANVASLLIGINEYVGQIDPIKRKGLYYDCHSVCRAIAIIVMHLKVADGYIVGAEQSVTPEGIHFTPKYCDHSWLTTPSGTIIDPYPAGVGVLCGTPLLINKNGRNSRFIAGLYVADARVTSRIAGREMHRKSSVLAQIIRQAKQTQAA